MGTWNAPTFVDVKMDAEIGSYQEDGGPREDPPFVDDSSASDEGSATPS